MRPVVPAYALAAAVALAWRAVALPWDFGGLFIQFVATAFGVMVFVAAKPPARGGFQRAVFYALFTASCGLWSFEAYYAPQAALPLVITCFVLALVWAGDKRTGVKLVNTLAVALPLAALSAYGIYSTIPAYRLRHLDAGRVRAVEFAPSSYGEGGASRIELTSREDVAEFVSTLAATTPYLPGRERDPSLWHATVVFDSGERFRFQLDEGTGDDPYSCRVLLGVTSYQNGPLCRLVRSRVPRPIQN
ncbi:MAG TPA: hypothetical protein VM914_03945 [Pyrinomonadaceae bacterium]|nr:hypothetical protein [Pyrinomonadaceae bacterium]